MSSIYEASNNLYYGYKGGVMRYIKVILTIIAVLLALNIIKSMIPSARATGVQDVNISTVYGLRTLPLKVEIVD